ncbi:hypothetical protein F3Y22_tig00110450pilonHSYRG00491 [Hibiscus syriacus]|uniref:Uncharacterized protein n=1 Tax=Hibiscus syriacus TaxID=106335 RepID=A0A6A3AIV6_HIBSY|nr:hypothetical protein F3Y22_tig00110450pilonHSYRG00491 [Hibiscus syriacus]
MENGNLKGSSKENRHGRTAHNMSSSSLRKKSDLTLVSKVRCGTLRRLLVNLQEVILGAKLSVLFPAIPLAVVAHTYGFARAWIFALSLIGLTPLAERVRFPVRKPDYSCYSSQIAYYTDPTETSGCELSPPTACIIMPFSAIVVSNDWPRRGFVEPYNNNQSSPPLAVVVLVVFQGTRSDGLNSHNGPDATVIEGQQHRDGDCIPFLPDFPAIHTPAIVRSSRGSSVYVLSF